MPEDVGPAELPADVTGDVKSSGGSFVDKAKAILSRKVGPVPVWLIVVVGGGGLAYLMLRSGGLSGALSGSPLSPGSGNASGAGGGASPVIPDILIPSSAAQNGGSASAPQTAPATAPTSAVAADSTAATQVPVSSYSPIFSDQGAGTPLIGQQAGGTDGGLSGALPTLAINSDPTAWGGPNIPTRGALLDQVQRAGERSTEGAGVPLADVTYLNPKINLTPPPPPPPAPTAPAQQTYRAGERSTEGAGVPYTPPAPTPAPSNPDTTLTETTRRSGPA
jgi:hypothetical protein